MKREIHGSTDVTSHFIDQAWVLATAMPLCAVEKEEKITVYH